VHVITLQNQVTV